MVWKLKERELTLDEALEQARAALSPFWTNSRPLLAVIKFGEAGTFSLHPIDSEFLKKRWVLGFADPVTSEGESLVRLISELEKRYSVLNLGFILILKPALRSLASVEGVERFAKSLSISFPYVFDAEELLFKVFGNPGRKSMLLIMDQGKITYRTPENDPFTSIEAQVQLFLRETDPGLPLLPLISDFGFLGKKLFEVALGGTPPAGVYDPLDFSRAGEFMRKGVQTIWEGAFKPNGTLNSRLDLVGNWIRDEERIATNDPNAELIYRIRTPAFSLFAQSLAKSFEPSAIEVLIDDLNVVDDYAGADLRYDDEQTSFAQFGVLRNYRLVKGLGDTGRVLRLKFPTADKRPVAIYSIRESEV